MNRFQPNALNALRVFLVSNYRLPKHWGVRPPLFPFSSNGDCMRLIEEVYLKADEDLICQKCGIDIPEGSNHLLESYIHKGTILSNTYCLAKKCNPPNNVRLRLFWGTIILSVSAWVIWGIYFK